MSTEQAVHEIRHLLRNELDDCERAIRNNDQTRALNELDDATRKLKRIMNNLLAE